MSLMDKVKTGFDKAREGLSDFAETTRLKHEIGTLADRKTELFGEIGRHVYELRAQGRAAAEVEAQCRNIDEIEQQIKSKGEEIARINTETGTPSQKTV